MRWYLRSKVHRATVTGANVNYKGSITLDLDLIEQVGFDEGEKVAVWDVTNGERLETYVIKGERGSGTVCMNGAAAMRIKKGHKVIIAGFELSEESIKPNIIVVDEKNKLVKYLEKSPQLKRGR